MPSGEPTQRFLGRVSKPVVREVWMPFSALASSRSEYSKTPECTEQTRGQLHCIDIIQQYQNCFGSEPKNGRLYRHNRYPQPSPSPKNPRLLGRSSVPKLLRPPADPLLLPTWNLPRDKHPHPTFGRFWIAIAETQTSRASLHQYSCAQAPQLPQSQTT